MYKNIFFNEDKFYSLDECYIYHALTIGYRN